MPQQDPKLDQLKLKYQSAINYMKQVGIRLTHVHMENGKLFIQGDAPSEQIKNQAWDQIKLADPGYADLTADIRVDPSLAKPGQSAGNAGGAHGDGQSMNDMQVYDVKAGDTLSKIARQFYGDSNQYMRIFDANRDQLQDPNKIQVGQKLKIPGAGAAVR